MSNLGWVIIPGKKMMTKEFTSIVTVEFAYNNRVAESKEEYIEVEEGELL